MKKAFNDVKSFVTILFAVALVALLFIAVMKSETMFETVFLLFTNLCTAVFTYFFTKKTKENDNNGM
jgi:Ca2+/Na+ antiporter